MSEKNFVHAWTSGTTSGRRKTLQISTEAQIGRANTVRDALGITKDSVVMTPPAHLRPYTPAFAAKLAGGRWVTTDADIQEGETFTDAIERLGVTMIVGTPGMKHKFWDERQTTSEKLEYVLFVGTLLTNEHFRRVQSWAPKAKVGTMYGVMELGAISMQIGEAKEGCVGKPLPGVDVRIEADGSILVKGEGLVRDPYIEGGEIPMTEDGYFKTGDLGYFDAEGRIQFNGGRVFNLPKLKLS